MKTKKYIAREIVKIIKSIDPLNGCDIKIILPCGSELRIELRVKSKKRKLSLVKTG